MQTGGWEEAPSLEARFPLSPKKEAEKTPKSQIRPHHTPLLPMEATREASAQRQIEVQGDGW